MPRTRKLVCVCAVEWNQVVFSDKFRFNLSSDDIHVRVWRRRGERLNSVFALQRHTATTAGAIFQQDNVCPRTARVSHTCFHTVTTLPSPAQSPGLSPIEHIWDHLGRRVEHLTSLNELEARLQQIWNEMSQDIIQSLYASTPDHIASCIRARGSQKPPAANNRENILIVKSTIGDGTTS
ncbi:transposable element Tcb2 transposase [Trichonephila clavipes]|nr:transposable element Tcb2 transposase [Trichonephila clavipes]